MRLKMSESPKHPDILHPLILLALKILILCVFLYPLVYYTLIHSAESTPNNATTTIEEPPAAVKPVKQKRIEVVKQPSCPLSHLRVILLELCDAVYVSKALCTPDDVTNLEKHKIPKTTSNNTSHGEPRGTIIGCVAAGLLITSLGAAIVELYKAKSQPAAQKSSKTPLSRKCSLADLTVLKHNRKELMRRDSILEMNETTDKIGFRPQLFRRSSFPVITIDLPQNAAPNTQTESRRNSIVQTEGRRLSVISESRRGSMDMRAHSLDEAQEKRHWTRLVHRH